MPRIFREYESLYFLGFVSALFSRYYLLLMFIILLLPLTITFSDENVTLTVNNNTGFYLHIIIDGEPYLYVKTGNNIIYESDKYVQLDIKAIYSPGQGVSGSADTMIAIKPYEEKSTGCSDNRSSGGGCDCSTTPASGGSKTWNVDADQMQASP